MAVIISTPSCTHHNKHISQSRDAIHDGSYPCTNHDVILLAALQCQFSMANTRVQKSSPILLNLYMHVPSELILGEYKELKKRTEPEAKLAYIQQCCLLPPYGATLFHVKERPAGRRRLVPRVLGISKDAVIVLDVKTKHVLKSWPIVSVHNGACTPNTFSMAS